MHEKNESFFNFCALSRSFTPCAPREPSGATKSASATRPAPTTWGWICLWTPAATRTFSASTRHNWHLHHPINVCLHRSSVFQDTCNSDLFCPIFTDGEIYPPASQPEGFKIHANTPSQLRNIAVATDEVYKKKVVELPKEVWAPHPTDPLLDGLKKHQKNVFSGHNYLAVRCENADATKCAHLARK